MSSHMSDGQLAAYRAKFQEVQSAIKRVLNVNKNPEVPFDHLHEYADKFTLVERVITTFVLSFFNSLEILGLADDVFLRAVQWSRDNVVSLKLTSSSTCELIKQTVRKQEADTKSVTDIGITKIERKVYNDIEEWHWSVKSNWVLSLERGGDGLPQEKRVSFTESSRSTVVTTRSNTPPTALTAEPFPESVDITALLRCFQRDAGVGSETASCSFTITRSHRKCHTPRRNKQVEDMLAVLQQVATFCENARIAVASTADRYGSGPEQAALVACRDASRQCLVPTWLLVEGGNEDDSGSGSDADDAAASDGGAAGAAAAARRLSGGVAAQNVSLAVSTARRFAAAGAAPAAPTADGGGELARVNAQGSVVELGDYAALLREERSGLEVAVVSAEATVSRAIESTAKAAAVAVANKRAAEGVSPGEGSLRGKDAAALVVLPHASAVVAATRLSIEAVEAMLYVQLRDAIGREVAPNDVAQYFELHWRKVLKEEYRPHPFAYSVRREGCHPDGTVELAAMGPDGVQPVTVFTRTVELGGSGSAREEGVEGAGDRGGFGLRGRGVKADGGGSSAANGAALSIPITAACKVQLRGQLHAHVLARQRFGGRHAALDLRLLARARRFSSFVVVIGTLASASELLPTAALLVRDMDDVVIPIVGDVVPTASEFADAISALSPDQQAFARGIRAMQLASTLFAFAVLPVKPQLERVLRLPPLSLLKEIKVTQDATDLVAKYSIPPDVLAYDGAAGSAVSEQVACVRTSVKSILQMIESEAQSERKAAQVEARRAKAEAGAVSMRISSLRTKGPPHPPRSMPMPPANAMMRVACASAPGGGDRGGLPPPPPPAGGGPPPPPPGGKGAPPRPQASPAPAPAPAPQPAHKGAKQTPTVHLTPSGDGRETPLEDVVGLPTALEARMERLPAELQARPVILKLRDTWSRARQDGLLSEPTKGTLGLGEQRVAKGEAFDLLDALTRSGALAYADAEVHVVVEMSSSFSRSLVESVIEENVNVIERVEAASLELISVLHGVEVERLKA